MATNWCIQKGVICDRVAASGYCAQSACTKVFQTGTARQTNADRIRAMSDEELAQRLLRYEGTETRATPYGGQEHIFHGPHGETCGTKEYALQLWIEWLDEQAED